jgi:enterochelin esterase-like enzyme
VVVDIVDVESRTKTYKNNDDVVKKLQEAFLATTTVSATTKQNIRFITGSIGETL